MSKKILAALIYTAIFVSWNACTYENADDKYPLDPCDPVGISFNQDIKTILDNHCYACHSNANALNAGSGIRLEDHPQVKIYVDNGKLLCSINHDARCSPMPLSRSAKIPACDIKTIEVWIAEGTMNN